MSKVLLNLFLCCICQELEHLLQLLDKQVDHDSIRFELEFLIERPQCSVLKKKMKKLCLLIW